jgi:hypothetical protein
MRGTAALSIGRRPGTSFGNRISRQLVSRKFAPMRLRSSPKNLWGGRLLILKKKGFGGARHSRENAKSSADGRCGCLRDLVRQAVQSRPSQSRKAILALDADEVPTFEDRGDPRRSGTTERVQDRGAGARE